MSIKIKDLNNDFTFKDLYNAIDKQAKIDYPNSEYIQDICTIYNTNHLCVSEVFTPLDMLEWQNTDDINAIYYKWNDIVLNVTTEATVKMLINDFNEYFKTVENMDI